MLRAAATAALRRLPQSQAPRRQARGLQYASPERRPLDGARWALYARLSAHLPSGGMVEELGRWLRERRPLSEEQVLFCVRRFRKFKQNKHALQVSPLTPTHTHPQTPVPSRENSGLIWIGDVMVRFQSIGSG
ncbi:Os01g0301700 [Oryza sativa Japonica Group]|uniref:Os01g0301700 protein n=1 Tax=Oryza sativa subsp. japonica TaxID=39947 RepID=A0A0P0V1I9_ORYSJ|nr:hypothetical protein EE612_001988 [Oryza sativa]BAS71723.1 Os01g0301700 [Oryza sativa Japonica Group]